MLTCDSTVISVNKGLVWHVMPSMDVVQAAPQRDVLVPRPPKSPALREHTESIMLGAEKRGFRLRFIGTAPLWSGHRVYAGPDDTEWVLMPAEEDPEVQSRYGLAVWSKDRRRLRAMVKAGFDPVAYTAHQVPVGTVKEGEPIPEGAFSPPVCASTAQLSATLGKVTEAGVRVAVVPLIASAAVATGMIVAVAAVAAAGLPSASAVAEYDPMLFGAVVAPGRPAVDGELASWFLLAQWNYEDEPQ